MRTQELASIWQIKCAPKAPNRLRNAILTFVLISVPLILSGCGGGGGSTSISASAGGTNGNATLESSNEDTGSQQSVTKADQQSTSSLESATVDGEQAPVIGEQQPAFNGSQIFPLTEVNRTATLSWTLPTKRSDGSDLQLYEIDTFNIYHTTEDGSVEERLEVNGDETTLNIDNLEGGKHLFTVTAVDINGLESDFSDIVTKTIL